MNILLIITGSIAAYKSLDLIRLLKKDGANVNVILTAAGAEFITPLAVTSVSGNPTYHDMFSPKDESEMGHIRLSREADLVVVAPASADIIAKMAHGLASDLASTCLLASDKPILISPAMNVKMWENKAVQRNVKQLKSDGVNFIGPEKGELACGEKGEGRMSEPEAVYAKIKEILA
ncbi:phosphopantothenoylcysteine decarboxylase [Rickettsiales bacterium]|nr:phosphopantothenoylcysteine decarboxylase [Rickettsiales bacterium]